MMRILEDKGYLRHEQDGPRYVYLPTGAPEKAKRSALRDMVTTLFDGSTSQAVAALIETADARLDDAELDKLQDLIRAARRQGR
jgi:predicted transcriptional regulator